MNVASWLSQAKTRIDRLDAELILLNALNQTDRTWLVAHAELEIPKKSLKKAIANLSRRAKKEPLAYILGYKEFYGRDFIVTKDTLIPRPETENIINLIPRKAEKILDVGTGSGCIGITIKLTYPEKTVICSDISKNALKIAKRNAQKLHADIKFVHSDLLSQISDQPDLIVANLPYVDRSWSWLDTASLSFEPETSLYASSRGLELIYQLIIQASSRQIPCLILEADPCQHQSIIDFAKTKNYQLNQTKDFILKFNYFE